MTVKLGDRVVVRGERDRWYGRKGRVARLEKDNGLAYVLLDKSFLRRSGVLVVYLGSLEVLEG